MTTLIHDPQARREAILDHARRNPPEEGYRWINLGLTERVVSGALALPMIGRGLKRGGLSGLALAVAGGFLAHRAATGYCRLYDALELDSAHDGHSITHMHKGVLVKKSFTVNRTPDDCYDFWRDFQNLPRFMTHLNSVQVIDARRSRWEAKAPLGKSVTWEAEIINERPNELIAWRSVEGSEIDNAGSVQFRLASGGRGTEVTVELNYEPPGGTLGRNLAWLLGEEPEIQVREDLRQFKQIMETGEIPTTTGQSSGRARD